ncbi:hypothetical protein PRUPE_2G051300 [Prunus persica]|uniref:Uncharacterized protein n=1 Tax=Prunus persica TaxID=3760 RepID=A0A251QBI0_PRUPE|nr:hypothetical protein PRUPE_2G051300 [Prunus persica]ONI21174.1 hypothetical protein PRUPE_2G051300 [Prunus persica]
MANKKLASKKKKSRNKSTRANPLSAETGAAYVASPSVANTTATPAPAQGLYARCLLKEYLKNYYQWDDEQFKRGGQVIIGSLVGKVAYLGSKGITHGRLTCENIFVIGNGPENLEVEIKDIPRAYNPAMPSYREQFLTLARLLVDTWKATSPMLLKHFFKMMEYCIPWFYFKQVQWHPLLLSSDEVAVVIFRLYTYLDIERKGWKKDYKNLIGRKKVDFGDITSGTSGTSRGAFAFAKVYSYPGVIYEPNALGALMFFRHALKHVNEHIQEDLKKENATRGETVNMLVQFFPKVPLELFNYMLYKRIDINTTIT